MHVEDDYFFSYDEVNEYLTEIFKESRVFCKHDIKYRFHPKTDDSAILIDTYHPIGSIGYSPIQALIGGKSLLSNMTEDNMVRNEDVSRAIFEAFHENAHIWQYNVAYMQRKPKNEIFEEMAKTRVISLYLPEYKNMSYILDTSEIHANMYAVNRSDKFFTERGNLDSRFAKMSLDEFSCNYCKRLYGSMFSDILSCNSSDTIFECLSYIISDVPKYKKFFMELLPDISVQSRNMKSLLNDKKILSQILSSKDGLDETEIFCKYIGKNHPEYFRGFPCIRDKYVKSDITGVNEKLIDKVLRITPKEWYDLENGWEDHDTEDGPDF